MRTQPTALQLIAAHMHIERQTQLAAEQRQHELRLVKASAGLSVLAGQVLPAPSSPDTLPAVPTRPTGAPGYVPPPPGPAPKEPLDGEEPPITPKEAPANKTKKKKAKKVAKSSHTELMRTSPSYRRSFEETTALHNASAPISESVRLRLAERGAVSPFAAGGVLASPRDGVRSVRELSEADAQAVRHGFNGADAAAAARAALPFRLQRIGAFGSRMIEPVAKPQSVEEAERARDNARANALAGMGGRK
jgi:hypothetical protein